MIFQLHTKARKKETGAHTALDYVGTVRKQTEKHTNGMGTVYARRTNEK